MDKRKFCGSFCVRFDTKNMRCELSDAEIYGGPSGHYRLRLNRKWLDDPKGEHLYFNELGLSMWISKHVFGAIPSQIPDLKYMERVKVKINPLRWEKTWTDTLPIQAYDGRWYVSVLLIGKGKVFVPCDDVIPLAPKGNAPAGSGAHKAKNNSMRNSS